MRKLTLLLTVLLCIPQLQAQFAGHTYVCDDETFDLLQNLSNSQLGKGEIFVFTTTHQDIGWLEQPEICIINRDTMWLTPFLERLEKDPTFKMDIEQSSVLIEYIHRHPEKKDFITENLRNGRICVGATYMQPYEEMYSDEALARQFYLGKKWLQKNFDGYKPISYFNVDVPGRTLQMAQIMQKAEVDNLVISRHERGLFNWKSPDGSSVRTYTPGHYIYFYNVLGMTDTAAVKELAKESILWYTAYNNNTKTQKAVMPAMLNYEFIWDQKNVRNLKVLMAKWNAVTDIASHTGRKARINLPKFKYAIADEFFARLDATTTQEIPSIQGERPDVWLYIHGPSHERALTSSRQGDVLLPSAEKIHSMMALTSGSFAGYPEKILEQAWIEKIYPDHGWGGQGGDITDAVFKEKYESALGTAQALYQQGSQSLASEVKVEKQKGMPVVLFNMLSWQRTDVVNTSVSFDPGYASSIQLTNAMGSGIPSQLTDVTYYSDGTIHTASLVFVAKEVPSLGYTTYYIKPSSAQQSNPMQEASQMIESDFYKVGLTKGGISSLFDKELNCQVLDGSKFLGGEVFTMQSVGNGAGEFDAVQLPTMEGFDKVSSYAPVWKVAEQGAVYTKYAYRSQIRHAVVEQTLTVYNKIKKIDLDISVLNFDGTLYREYRMAIPTAITGGQVSYEVPYGVLNVGKDEMPGAAGERYYTPNAELHPRGIVDWISVSGASFGMTLASSVGVVDYLDPTNAPVNKTILQPILFASRKSCHYAGKEYNQYGDHHFRFSLTTHQPGWQNGSQFGKEANNKLLAVVNPRTYQEAKLPATQSFFDLKNKNVVVSAIKKCEDDNSLIIRLYNQSNEPQKIDLNMAIHPKKILRTNLIEEEKETVDRITLAPFAIETYKLIY